MAGQVICSFFRVVFERLNDIIKEDRLGPFWGVKEELDDVFKNFCKIKGVLTDAEQKQFMDGEEAVQFWLRKLNEAAYEADDVLDELQVNALQLVSKEKGSSEEMNFLQNIHEYNKKLSKIFRELDEAAAYEADDVFDELQVKALQLSSERMGSREEMNFPQNMGSREEMNFLPQNMGSREEMNFPQNIEEEIKKFYEMFRKQNEAAYEADDVLDELQVNALQLASEEKGSPEEMNLPRDIQEYIKLSKKFRKIAKEIKGLDLQKGNVEKRMDEICPGREPTSPLATEPHPYGRDEDREKLLKILLKDDYKSSSCSLTRHPRAPTRRPLRCRAIKDISICSIVGIGGIGKTTLAQMVYNDDRAAKHFAYRFWVCVSNDFDAERIVKEIVASSDFKKLEEQMAGASKKLDSFDTQNLEDRLEKLSSTRFLLVLDDVWEENQEKWNKFKAIFRAGFGEGSSIMVTTRLQTVANITSTVPPLCIQVLSETHCWDLFKKYAFGLGNKRRSALVKIGKEIVHKCGGLPLAVKALGSLLRHKNEENEWLSIKDSPIWELPPSDENNILPALRLSYYHLPPLLKQCFVYCSIFPQDYEIDKDDLIQKWMANSLVQSKAGKELEDVGNEIFNALLWRSFFQDARKDEYGDKIKYKMHDLVHDLANYMAGGEYFVGLEGRSREICKITRHVSIPHNWEVSTSPSSILELIQRALPCLRSLIIRSESEWPFSKPEIVFRHFCRLRVLDLKYSKIRLVPDGIDEMIHLRYLDLSGNPIRSLPKCIFLLSNLQTLKLRSCLELKALPNYMSKMSSLRHLDIKQCSSLKSMPVGFGELCRLRALNCFILSSTSGYGMSELHKLNVGAELEIKGLEHVKSSNEAKAANLVEKKNIRFLDLYWSLEVETEDEDSQQQQHQEVIDGLQPHAKLRTLLVQGYRGPNSPTWLTPSCVPNLVKIHLRFCRCERLSPLGKLGSLKVLNMYRMDSLKFIVMDDDDDARTFPSLEELKLLNMRDLEGWSSSSLSSQAAIAPVFPRLKQVEIMGCPKLEGEVPLSGSPVKDVRLYGSRNGMVLGSLHDLPYLPFLDIGWYNEMENLPPGALQNLTSLQKLTISYCDNLKTLPVQLKSLTTLTELTINWCRNLVSLAEGEGGLRNLSSLGTLTIDNCDALKRLPELDKTSLVYMTIKKCPQLEFSTQDFEQLVSLEMLELDGLPKLTCFPKGIKHSAAKLQQLQFKKCSEYGAVDLPDWIGTLTSLRVLSISAPKNWKVLPQWLQNCTALQDLSIYGCDEELKSRWEKKNEQREEYSFNMISHVPVVQIY